LKNRKAMARSVQDVLMAEFDYSKKIDWVKVSTNIVDNVFLRLAIEILKTGHVEIRRFGSFDVKLRAARTARNPKTNTVMPIPPTKRVVFRPLGCLEQIDQNTVASQ